MFGMREDKLQGFMEKFLAAAVANQAVLKCKSLRLPLTEDNVICLVGDFFDPTDPAFEGLVDKINDAIEYVIVCPDEAPIGGGHYNDNVIPFRRTTSPFLS